MKELIEEHQARGRVAFATVNTDRPEHWQTCSEVRNLPFLALYRDGSVVRTVTGLLKPDQLTEALNDLVS